MLLRMLPGCGFRLGEPLAARVKDVNFRNGTILIRHAKNDKRRVVAMDRTLTEMLERYYIAMGIKTEPESCLFPAASGQGASASKGTFELRFKNLFRDLDFDTIDGFLKWIEAERGCSVSTRNLRLSALASFAGYAQNRNFEAATVFANAVKRVPVKKVTIQPRVAFTLDEVSVLLRLPDPKKRLGFRDQVLLNLMYASGARAQEICDLKVRDFLVEKNLYKLTITGKGNKTRRIVIAKPRSPSRAGETSRRKWR